MDFEKDLGLELLMNNKKKLPSDSISIISRSVSDKISDISDIAEAIDVKDHLQPPPRKHYSDNDDDDEEEEYDESDKYESEESSQAQFPQQPQQRFQQNAPRHRMSDEEILNEKKEMLYQFERLERKGVMLPRKFTLASNLEEMKIELERLKRDRELDTSVKFQRRMLMTAVTGIEFASDKIPIFKANLQGWSGSVNDELDEYDDIFVELHDKYKGKAKMAPELRLLGGLAGSAFMYHLTHKWSNSLPGIDAVLKQNPELAAKLAEATKNTMNQQQTSAGNFFGGLGGIGSMLGGMFGGAGMPPQPPPMPQDMAPQGVRSPRTQTQTSAKTAGKMRGPSNVDDILNELNALNADNNRVEMMSTISGSEIGDDDVSSINGLFLNKRGGAASIDLDI